jgi:uncharacterized protein (DUF4415 family)
MTAKRKKAKRRKARARPGKLIELQASVEDDLLSLAEEEGNAESRWNRPRKRRISLRVETEVVDWFKSKGRLPDPNQPDMDIEKSNDGGIGDRRPLQARQGS